MGLKNGLAHGNEDVWTVCFKETLITTFSIFNMALVCGNV